MKRGRARQRLAAEESADDEGIPRATYRLQLNAGFTFADATALVPYLAALGVSHVYCSPYFARARRRSTPRPTTWSITTPSTLEIGERGVTSTSSVRVLRAHGMGHVVDIVPNPRRRGLRQPLVASTCWRTARPRARRVLRHRLERCRSIPSGRTRCWCRCSPITTGRSSSAASCCCDSSRTRAPPRCTTTPTARARS